MPGSKRVLSAIMLAALICIPKNALHVLSQERYRAASVHINSGCITAADEFCTLPPVELTV